MSSQIRPDSEWRTAGVFQHLQVGDRNRDRNAAVVEHDGRGNPGAARRVGLLEN